MEEQDAQTTAEEQIAEPVNGAVEEADKSAEAQDAEDTASKKRKKEPMTMSRRNMLIGVGSTVALLGLGSLRYVGHNPLCRPPGGQDETHLVSACIR